MTHRDIYTKFMIEYDKANVTSSYPALTEYEAAVLLDKAYLALIGQKVTGNNLRKAIFESDVKSVSDLAPLVVHRDIELFTDEHRPALNIVQYRLPEDFMYYVSSSLNQSDDKGTTLLPMELVPHKIAEKFFKTPYNLPWIKNPVCYVEGKIMFAVYDPINRPNVTSNDVAHLSYIKYPKSFISESLPSQNRFTLDISRLNGTDTI